MVREMDGDNGELIIPVALNGVTGRMGYNPQGRRIEAPSR